MLDTRRRRADDDRAKLADAQVEQLHGDLRDCCDLMGIGLGGQRRDTVVEADAPPAGAATASGTKDLGDVRSDSRASDCDKSSVPERF